MNRLELDDEPAGELVAGQHESGGHHGDIGGVGMSPEAVGPTPVAHQDQNGGERQQLADLDTDVEGQKVGDQPIRCDVELADLGREAEAVENPKTRVASFVFG